MQSQYIARIEGHIGAVTRIESVQAELNQDIGAALGQSDLRVNVALAELELCKARFDRAVRDGAPFARRAALVEAFNKQRHMAERRLRELLIHREACGFRRNHILNELYPIAPKLTLPESFPENDIHS